MDQACHALQRWAATRWHGEMLLGPAFGEVNISPGTWGGFTMVYPLVICYIAIENGDL